MSKTTAALQHIRTGKPPVIVARPKTTAALQSVRLGKMPTIAAKPAA